ncbi:hypothetical protein ACFE04_023219 [Oxalis oulophora]
MKKAHCCTKHVSHDQSVKEVNNNVSKIVIPMYSPNSFDSNRASGSWLTSNRSSKLNRNLVWKLNKLEPGEDERALSQVIVDAISPRRNPGDASVVDKVKDVVTSLIWSEEQENPKANLARANNTTSSTFQGYWGHVDRKPSEARLYPPLGVTVDETKESVCRRYLESAERSEMGVIMVRYVKEDFDLVYRSSYLFAVNRR